jgi:hypothetical protein
MTSLHLNLPVFLGYTGVKISYYGAGARQNFALRGDDLPDGTLDRNLAKLDVAESL